MLAITALLEDAVAVDCEVKLTGVLNGNVLKHTYIAVANSFSAIGNTEDSSLNLEELLETLSSDDSASISLTVYPKP